MLGSQWQPQLRNERSAAVAASLGLLQPSEFFAALLAAGETFLRFAQGSFFLGIPGLEVLGAHVACEFSRLHLRELVGFNEWGVNKQMSDLDALGDSHQVGRSAFYGRTRLSGWCASI